MFETLRSSFIQSINQSCIGDHRSKYSNIHPENEIGLEYIESFMIEACFICFSKQTFITSINTV